MSYTKNVRKGGMTLRTFSVLAGSRIFDRNSGTNVIVKDVFFDNNGIVHGLLAKRHPWSKCRFFPISGFLSESPQMPNVTVQELWTVCHKPKPVLGQSVTKQAEMDAMITDVYFSDNLDTLVAVETTEGFFSDMRHGRQTLFHNASYEINGESFFGQ
jgi:uncharacterized protein YrrD